MEVEQTQKAWRKCCFCFPLRKGLLCFAYITLIRNVVFFLAIDPYFEIFTSLMDLVTEVTLNWNDPAATYWVYVLPTLVELCYGVVLLYGLHKNDPKVLYAYLWYGVTSMVLTVYLGLSMWSHVIPWTLLFLNVVIGIFYQGYITLLVWCLMEEINQKPLNKSSYSLKPTDERDVESQPMPSAPVHQPGTERENTCL